MSVFSSFLIIAKGQEFVKCNNKKRFRKKTFSGAEIEKWMQGNGLRADEKYLRDAQILNEDEGFSPAIGYLVPDGEVVVDIDEGFEDILRLLEHLKIKTTYTYSKRGGHLFFKMRPSQQGLRNTNDSLIALGIQADIKVKGGYVVLPEGRPERKWGEIHELAPLPWFLEPLHAKKKRDSLYGMGDGDGRNSALVSVIGTLWQQGISEKRCKQAARWINEFIFSEPLPQAELRASVKSVLSYPQGESKQSTNAGENGAEPVENPYLFYNKDGRPSKINQMAVAEAIVQLDCVRNIKNNCFYYKDGYFQEGEYLLIEKIKELVKDEFVLTHQNITGCYNLIMKDVRLQVTADDFNKNKHLINFKDCVFDTNSGVFLEPAKEYMFNYQIPHSVRHLGIKKGRKNFNRTLFGEFLEKKCKMDKTDQKMLVQFLAAALSGNVSTKCFLMLTGRPNTGKSVLLHFFEKLMGNINCSSIPLQDLNEHKFALAELFGKRMNICADITSTALKKVDKLKQITGGDLIMGEKKGKNPFAFQPQCLLAFSCNQMPLFLEEKSNAVYTRMRVLEMDKEIKMTQKEVEDLWSDEAVAGVIPYLLGLMPVGEVCRSEKSARQVKELQEEGDSVTAFFNNCIKTGVSYSNPKRKEIYEHYLTFCNLTGRTPFGSLAFNKLFRQKGVKEVHKNDGWHWKNIEMLPIELE